MELLLWRWSTAVQFTSALMIAVFFGVLARSVRRAELQPWVVAWLANVVALLIPIAFWYLRPDSAAAFLAMRWGYFLSKTLFVVLLVVGAHGFVGGGLSVRPGKPLLLAVGVYSGMAAAMLHGIDQAGTLQSGVTAVLLAAGAVLIVARRAPGSGWLVCGFAARAILAAVESVAYGSRLVPGSGSSSRTLGFFLASHSSLDAGAEWVIALGCVLVFYRTIQRELTQSNSDLLATQSVLRELVEIDPLTGLPNRRSLPPVLHDAAGTGATVLFFDLNDFKGINDAYGHQAGDDCLRRFARALQDSFGPEDHLARFAGDEFVVVARQASPDQIAASLNRLREQLRFERASGPAIQFAVGQAQLPVGGNPDEAIRAADAAMYTAKGSHGLRSV
jgi:diguanylate cyclase (GGDEF)-like protein